MLITGFSTRGRGEPKSIISSSLPLPTGNIHNHHLAFNRESVVLQSPPPLPPISIIRHDQLEKDQPSTKGVTKLPPQLQQKNPPYFAASSPISLIASASTHFEGKHPTFYSPPPILDTQPPIQAQHNPFSNISQPGATTTSPEPVCHQGMILRLLLLPLWVCSFLTRRCL